MNELITRGTLLISPEDKDFNGNEPSSYIVVGPPRSGTSLIAGMMQMMGVQMGKTATAPVYEDVTWDKLFKAKNPEKKLQLLNAKASQHSENHKKWGWKRPILSIEELETIDQVFPNPTYIIVFRDIFSIALRNHVSMREPIVTNLSATLSMYEKIVRFLEKNQARALLISYEKALRYQDELVHALSEAIDVELDDNLFEQCKDFISTTPPLKYLEETRITRSRGRIDYVSQKQVLGWAKYLILAEHTNTAEVDIYVNSSKVARIKADRFRADLKGTVHPTGHCAFEYTFPIDAPLSKGDIVRARVTNDVRDVNNSPYVYTEQKSEPAAVVSKKVNKGSE